MRQLPESSSLNLNLSFPFPLITIPSSVLSQICMAMSGEPTENPQPPSTSNTSRRSSRNREANVEALDFDKNRKGPPGSEASGASSPTGLLRDSESLLSNVVDGIINKDRERMKRQVQRYASYASAILSWYEIPNRVTGACRADNL